MNGNKQKIEDANGVIKRHTEQLIELEPEINDLKHEMSELDRHVKGKYILEIPFKIFSETSASNPRLI